jgi:hypothetical protein
MKIITKIIHIFPSSFFFSDKFRKRNMASGSVPGPPRELANIREMLSEEMWIQILGYLDQKELCTLSEVDSQFYRLARDPAVWRKECESNLMTVPSDF